MNRTDRIIAYAFATETLCPPCTIDRLISEGTASPAARDMRVGDVLDQIADSLGIDRHDEKSFDSGDIPNFPKVVYTRHIEAFQRFDQRGDYEHCERCGEKL